MGKIEKVICFKGTCTGYDKYHFVYTNTDNTNLPPEGVIIGRLETDGGYTCLKIADDSLVVSHLTELMYDCLELKKSLKIKF